VVAAALVAVALSGCAGSGGGGSGGSGASGTASDSNSGQTVVAKLNRTATATVSGAGSGAGTAGSATATGTTTAAQLDTRTPALRHMQAVLVNTLKPLGAKVGVLAIDLNRGDQVLFDRNAGTGRPPASVEKIYTSVALLHLLGPNARLHTDLLGTGSMEPGGVWNGNLYFRGDGDPTLGDGSWNKAYESGNGPTLSQLVTQLRRDGIRRVTGAVYADPSRFDNDLGGPATGNQPDIPDYGGELSALVFDHGYAADGESPAVFAARELVLTMRMQGIKTGFSHHAARTPAGAKMLASVVSPPLSVMLKLMDVPSDDLFADLLTKQLGYHVFGEGQGTLAAGATLVRQVLAEDYGLQPTLFDGSGLDKKDRSSPEQIVSLLRQLWQTPDGHQLYQALPVVGVSGTVQGIGVGTPAVRHCVAKTGTLNNVTNLAGYCNAADGQAVAFALMVDGPSNWQSIAAFSRIVGALAAY
jgi:serine-type D-Ala-D-Ala carboxypeptidase/endopeptidase (penicillin-binding protein 4)